MDRPFELYRTLPNGIADIKYTKYVINEKYKQLIERFKGNHRKICKKCVMNKKECGGCSEMEDLLRALKEAHNDLYSMYYGGK